MTTVIDGVSYNGCPGTVEDAIVHNHPLEPVDAKLPTRSKGTSGDAPGVSDELLSLLGLFVLMWLAVFIAGGL